VPTFCELKNRELGEKTSVVPFPLSLSAWGLSSASSVMVTVPNSCPTSSGVNLTVMKQVPPETKLVPQSFVWEKVPDVTAMGLVKSTVTSLVLVSVATCAVLVVPRPCDAKLRVGGFSIITAPVP